MLKSASIKGPKNVLLINQCRSLFSGWYLALKSHSRQNNTTLYEHKVGPLTQSTYCQCYVYLGT